MSGPDGQHGPALIRPQSDSRHLPGRRHLFGTPEHMAEPFGPGGRREIKICQVPRFADSKGSQGWRRSKCIEPCAGDTASDRTSARSKRPRSPPHTVLAADRRRWKRHLSSDVHSRSSSACGTTTSAAVSIATALPFSAAHPITTLRPSTARCLSSRIFSKDRQLLSSRSPTTSPYLHRRCRAHSSRSYRPAHDPPPNSIANLTPRLLQQPPFRTARPIVVPSARHTTL